MRITIDDDFDLEKIAESGQCFRVRRFDDGAYRFMTGRELVYVTPLCGGKFSVECSPGAWETLWRDYFDLGRDYRRIRMSVSPGDGFMREMASCGEGLRVLRQEPWETLVTFIISQRKSIPAIKTAVEKLASRLGEPVTSPRETVFAFPAPEAILRESDEVAASGVGYRLSYIIDAARKVASGELDLATLSELSDEELRAKLKSVHGVGDKVANCVALFAYGRMACVPVDTWIARIIAAHYGGENPFVKYGSAGGIMQQYAFCYAQTHKK